jgi:hypothetical protein
VVGCRSRALGKAHDTAGIDKNNCRVGRYLAALRACAAAGDAGDRIPQQRRRAIYSPNMQPSPLITPATEIVSGVPQLIYSLPLDGSLAGELAGLDFGVLFDRLIIGPSQYPLTMATAFIGALKSGGVSDAEKRVCASMIPIRG